LDAIARELVERLKSDLTPDDNVDPLLNALYLVAGEFLGLMHEVKRKRYLVNQTDARL
jgi:hypothetical protein